MSKVTVTKVEMEAIEEQRDVATRSLDNVINFYIHEGFIEGDAPLNEMSIEQIVLAWHGYAEVELVEYVGFDEAMKAHDNGSLVSFHPKEGSKITVLHQVILKSSRLGNYSLRSLKEGIWSIEGDNQ